MERYAEIVTSHVVIRFPGPNPRWLPTNRIRKSSSLIKGEPKKRLYLRLGIGTEVMVQKPMQASFVEARPPGSTFCREIYLPTRINSAA